MQSLIDNSEGIINLEIREYYLNCAFNCLEKILKNICLFNFINKSFIIELQNSEILKWK